MGHEKASSFERHATSYCDRSDAPLKRACQGQELSRPRREAAVSACRRRLLEATTVDVVVIDTDSPMIRDHVEEHLPEVVVLERPEHLRAGEIPMNTVLANSIAQLDGDVFLQTHSTNPFLTAETIDAAVSTFHAQGVDSLFTATPEHARYWWDADRPGESRSGAASAHPGSAAAVPRKLLHLRVQARGFPRRRGIG